MIDRLDPRSGQLRSGLWCYNKLWKPAKTTPKMWRNFVFLQNSLFSWEVFTVISRKILFFWEKCHFEKNSYFFEKKTIFSPDFPSMYTAYTICELFSDWHRETARKNVGPPQTWKVDVPQPPKTIQILPMHIRIYILNFIEIRSGVFEITCTTRFWR